MFFFCFEFFLWGGHAWLIEVVLVERSIDLSMDTYSCMVTDDWLHIYSSSSSSSSSSDLGRAFRAVLPAPLWSEQQQHNDVTTYYDIWFRDDVTHTHLNIYKHRWHRCGGVVDVIWRLLAFHSTLVEKICTSFCQKFGVC